jgi:hypothetical protein
VLAKTPLILPIPLENGKIEAELGEMLETTLEAAARDQPDGRQGEIRAPGGGVSSGGSGSRGYVSTWALRG